MLKQMDKLEVVTEEKVLLLPAPEVVEFTVEGIKFKSINTVPNDAMSVAQQLIAVNEQELPIPKYAFERLGRGHCGGTWAISKDLVLKINEIYNRADIELERFVDGECLEDLQGLPLVPKLYAYSYDKQYMIVERIHGMQVGECEYNMNNFTAQLGASIVPKFWNWKKWIDKACEFQRGCLQRGWIPSDLHGENVMIDRGGNLTVVDYGLFKKVGVHTKEIRESEYDYEYRRIAETIRMIAREIKSANRLESQDYKPANPLTWEEFKPSEDKKIEEEAKELVRTHKDKILQLLGITESTSSMNEVKAHEDMERQPLDFLKLMDVPLVKMDACVNEHANQSYLSKIAVSRRFVGARKVYQCPPLLPILKQLANREHRTAPQVAELPEENEEVAIPFGKPVLLGCDWGRAHKGFIAIGKQTQGLWRGKL